MFGLVPKPIWSKLIPANERNGIPQNANCLLLELEDGRKGLVDTGCGPAANFTEKERKLHGLSEGWPLLDHLKKRGLAAEDLDFVILTHLHWDHAGGVVTGNPTNQLALSFPRAVHYLHATEWEDALSQDPLLYKSYPESITRVLEEQASSAVRLVEEDEVEIMPGIKMFRSGGHTRGHCVVTFDAAAARLEHAGADALPHVRRYVYSADMCPTQHHLRLVFQTAYDTAPLDTRAWKREWLPRIAAEPSLLLFDHDPELIGGTIRPDDAKEFVVEQALTVQ